jgi:hypothetical protein
MDITFVEHMDEVLSHALIVRAGESIFKKVDIPLDVPVEGKATQEPAIN